MDTLYDVFICHASKDKAAFVAPLAVALQSIGLRVWYDDEALEGLRVAGMAQHPEHGAALARLQEVGQDPRLVPHRLRWVPWNGAHSDLDGPSW